MRGSTPLRGANEMFRMRRCRNIKNCSGEGRKHKGPILLRNLQEEEVSVLEGIEYLRTAVATDEPDRSFGYKFKIGVGLRNIWYWAVIFEGDMFANGNAGSEKRARQMVARAISIHQKKKKKTSPKRVSFDEAEWEQW